MYENVQFGVRFRTQFIHMEKGYFHIMHTFTFYSDLNEFTGLATAAFIAWKLMVTRAMKAAIEPANKNTHHEIAVW